MTKTFKSLSTSFTSERNASLDVDHETPPVNFDLSAFLTEIELSSSRFAPLYANTLEQAGVSLEASTPFAGTSDRTGGGSDIWNSEYWDAEMRGYTPRIRAFTIPSIPIRSRKSRRLSEVSNRPDAEVTADPSAIVVIQNSEDNTEGVSLPNQEETPVVKDGSQKIPYVTNMQSADDASARGSFPDELNEPKGPGDASRSKGKGKVDPVDMKVEKRRISAKAKADLKAGRIPTFRIGGTYEVFPSEAPAAQSLGVIPPAFLLVNFDSTATPPCPAVQRAVNVSQTPPPRAPSLTPLPRLASELSSESSLSKRRRTTKIINSGSRIVGAYEAVVAEKEEKIKSLRACTDVDATRKELDRQKARVDSWEVLANANRQSEDDYAAQVERIISRRSAMKHAAELMRSQVAVLHEVRDTRRVQMSMEKMVEADYELPPGLLENYVKEEKEYLAKVKSFDSLGDDTLFPTPPPPSAGLPRDVASQVPEGINEHGSFLSLQDNQDGDKV
ncbi:hypothetical protein AALP_AA4G050400 [Arabis alpina]|uniref:Uncharacterized protein n=1 Tax=Arabis alpina TaxID=50452 RepID=A0A087H191_ARAAL|nr:hypothetical protein AALP_AA4G050400 [Arabis alpina]